MADIQRCPTCNKIGSYRLGGYCKHHVPPKHNTWKRERNPAVRDYYGTDSFFRTKPFFSEEYGCIKDKFDINPRY